MKRIMFLVFLSLSQNSFSYETISNPKELALEENPVGKTFLIYTNDCSIFNSRPITLKCLLRGMGHAYLQASKESAKKLTKPNGAFQRKLECKVSSFDKEASSVMSSVNCGNIISVYDDKIHRD